MSRRNRNLTIAAVVLLGVVVEVGLQSLRSSVACVRVVNQGGAPITHLRLVSGQSEATLDSLPAGETANLFLDGRGRQTLIVTFQQQGNALSNFKIPIFDPASLQREGSSLVVVIRPNEFERYQDEGEPSRLSRLGSWLWSWLEKSLESP